MHHIAEDPFSPLVVMDAQECDETMHGAIIGRETGKGAVRARAL